MILVVGAVLAVSLAPTHHHHHALPRCLAVSAMFKGRCRFSSADAATPNWALRYDPPPSWGGWALTSMPAHMPMARCVQPVKDEDRCFWVEPI